MKIVKNTLDCLPVRNMRTVHELIDTVYSKGNIKLGEGKILKTTHNTTIELWIFKSRAFKSSKLNGDKHGGRNYFGGMHVGSFEKVRDVMSLGHEQATGITIDL